MVDSPAVNDFRLHSGDNRPSVPLAPGGHGLSVDRDGNLQVVDDPGAPVVVTIDRRGAWLGVNGDVGVHVNGRPVRRTALLRPGDVLHLGSTEARLDGRSPDAVDPDVPTDRASEAAGDARAVLRGLGGVHHGRSYSIAGGCVIGSAADARIVLDDVAAPSATAFARLDPVDGGVLLRDLGAPGGIRVNGHAVRNAMLRSGDQLLLGGRHRFVLELPGGDRLPQPVTVLPLDPEPELVPVQGASRLPWVLLAALGLAALLALLLLGNGGATGVTP